MTSSTKLTSKLMEEKLKKGWTPAEFAEKLGITSEDFLQQLGKTFEGRTYDYYMRRIK